MQIIENNHQTRKVYCKTKKIIMKIITRIIRKINFMITTTKNYKNKNNYGVNNNY